MERTRRGRVLDRFGVPVAENRDSYRVLLVPEQAGDVEAALDRLSRFMPLSERARERVLRAAGRQPRFRAITVADDLDWQTFSAINLNAPDLAGVTPDVGEVRAYPYGASFAHVVGYVQPPNDTDIENNPREAERLLRHPGFRVGKTGVEVAREQDLRGTARENPNFAKFAKFCKISKISEKFRKFWQNSSKFLKKCDFRAVQRSALCRSRRELSNAYLLAKFGFDTAENEPCKVCR